MENKSTLGLVFVVTGALVFIIGVASFFRNPDVSIISQLLPAPTPYAFKVAATKQQFYPFRNNSTPLGSWIVSIPGDNKVYTSPIPISNRNMLLVNFVKGKSGRATFKVKEREWNIKAELAESAWYETNFYTSGKTDEWNTRIKQGQDLQFQAQDNVALRVELYKR